MKINILYLFVLCLFVSIVSCDKQLSSKSTDALKINTTETKLKSTYWRHLLVMEYKTSSCNDPPSIDEFVRYEVYFGNCTMGQYGGYYFTYSNCNEQNFTRHYFLDNKCTMEISLQVFTYYQCQKITNNRYQTQKCIDVEIKSVGSESVFKEIMQEDKLKYQMELTKSKNKLESKQIQSNLIKKLPSATVPSGLMIYNSYRINDGTCTMEPYKATIFRTNYTANHWDYYYLCFYENNKWVGKQMSKNSPTTSLTIGSLGDCYYTTQLQDVTNVLYCSNIYINNTNSLVNSSFSVNANIYLIIMCMFWGFLFL